MTIAPAILEHYPTLNDVQREIIGHLDLTGLATADIAGPGFINFQILPTAYAARVAALIRDERLGVQEGSTLKLVSRVPSRARASSRGVGAPRVMPPP